MAVRGTLQSSGQNCAGAERFYVHKDIYSAFVSQVTKIVKSVSAVSVLFSVNSQQKEITIRAAFVFILNTDMKSRRSLIPGFLVICVSSLNEHSGLLPAFTTLSHKFLLLSY